MTLNRTPWTVTTMQSTGGVRYVLRIDFREDRPTDAPVELARNADGHVYAYRTRGEAQDHADRLNAGR